MVERKLRSTAFSDEFIAAKKAKINLWERYTTVMFDSEEDYVLFTDYVGDVLGGLGVELTDMAIPGAIRVSPELLGLTHDRFVMREATKEDEEKHLATVKGTHPFDPESIRGGHVYGLGHLKKG